MLINLQSLRTRSPLRRQRRSGEERPHSPQHRRQSRNWRGSSSVWPVPHWPAMVLPRRPPPQTQEDESTARRQHRRRRAYPSGIHSLRCQSSRFKAHVRRHDNDPRNGKSDDAATAGPRLRPSLWLRRAPNAAVPAISPLAAADAPPGPVVRDPPRARAHGLSRVERIVSAIPVAPAAILSLCIRPDGPKPGRL